VDEFAAFCDAVDRRDRSADHLDRDGEVIETPVYNRHGERSGERTVLSPWWQVWKGANDAMLRFGGRFGLSPSDRAALKVDHGRQRQSNGEDLLTG
jgi:phage terminase small subunit